LMEEDFFKNMDLPKTNHFEELETLSEHNLYLLFPPDRFELCTRDKRDKGIDLTYEIKKDGNHTGIRFVLQLKATKSIQPNKHDGSYSVSLDTSNINYLLNGTSAFYILYVIETKTFYYESILDFLKTLIEKGNDWEKQASHTLKFKKKLLPNEIGIIYNESIKRGIAQREINEISTIISASGNKTDRITIDAEFNVSNDTQTREFIEALGFDMINNGGWQKVIEIHKTATGNIATSALYNLVLGIANYYCGFRFDAFIFLKTSTKLKSELSNNLHDYLLYFDTIVKYSIGLLEDNKYRATMSELSNSKTVGLYIKLDNARREYAKSASTNINNFEHYLAAINEILNNPKASENLKLTAKCELVFFQGIENVFSYINKIIQTNVTEEITGPDIGLRLTLSKELMNANHIWHENVKQLLDASFKVKNHFAYYTALAHKIKVSYQFHSAVAIIHIDKELPGYIKPPSTLKETSERWISDISKAKFFFNGIGHVENTIAASFTLYEILHYIGDYSNAKLVIEELEIMIDPDNFSHHKQRLDLLKNGGTSHEILQAEKDEAFRIAKEKTNEQQKIVEEMQQMDNNEKAFDGMPQKGDLVIDLFPIGYFKFPETQKEEVYSILQINDRKAKRNFDEAFDMYTPIANIYYNPIETEGPREGGLAYRGIESWRNLFRIRKAFYENKFFRVRMQQ
ncbi:MAG: hypothetical protein JWO03_436, partial [Bacteroidetes bacterium]|nr:hypothetical protein [Bacteroidota bacterium]